MKIFTKMIRLILYMTLGFTSLNINAQNLIGEWSGELKVTSQVKLKLIFHIKNNAISLDSPDQGAYGINGDIIFLSKDSVNVKIPKIMAGFHGTLKGDIISGELQQGGMCFPLQLTRGVKKANRPQTPQSPFPYMTEDLKIVTDVGTIAGTLSIPENANKKTPLAILVTGSGQQNRDEELFEHKPFAVIADYLARNGIASFRYDDRGIGESTGDVLFATTADFAADAEAAVDYLRHSGRFGKTGIIGHSEGGLIAYMLGAKPKTLDFIVSVAGPSIKGSKTIGYQNKISLLKSGISEKDADDFSKAIEAVLEFKLSHPETVEVRNALINELYPQFNDSQVTKQLGASLKAVLSAKTSNPWMFYFIGYDPASDLRKLQSPTLIIYGGKDMQVPPSLNAGLARRLASKATVKEFPELNHLMQHAKTGDTTEYKEIEETISPEVLEAITTFINTL